MLAEMTAPSRLPASKTDRDRIASQVVSLSQASMQELEFTLGVAIIHEGAPPNVQHSANYIAVGKRGWDALRPELHARLCASTREPQVWVKELLAGDPRHVALGLVDAVAATYDVTVGIAVPAAAFVLKIGLHEYCASDPPAPPARTFRSLLRRSS